MKIFSSAARGGHARGVKPPKRQRPEGVAKKRPLPGGAMFIFGPAPAGAQMPGDGAGSDDLRSKRFLTALPFVFLLLAGHSPQAASAHAASVGPLRSEEQGRSLQKDNFTRAGGGGVTATLCVALFGGRGGARHRREAAEEITPQRRCEKKHPQRPPIWRLSSRERHPQTI